MNEVMASATFIAGAIVVVLLTLPLVRTAQRRFGAIRTFIVAITIQATAIVLFADPRAAIVGPLVYCLFLLSNSAAAASLNGARAAEVEHDHQGLLNMALLTVGMIGFIGGVVLAAGLLGPLGFGVVLALIGVGHGRDRRRLPPAARRRHDRRSTSSSAAPPSTPATRRRSRATSASRTAPISLVTRWHKDSPPPEAREVVDGRGLMLCPGFIDLHTHSALRSFDDPLLTPKLAQGFTTEVINPDGLAPAPGRARAAARSARRTCGRSKAAARRHGPGRRSRSTSTRSTPRGPRSRSSPRSATAPCATSCSAAAGSSRPPRACARCGARCASASRPARACSRSGSSTCPGAYAATDELVAVAEEAAAFGVPLVPHVRNEGNGLLEAVAEMIDVARRSGAPLHLSHLKSLADESLIEPLLELLESAADRARRHVRPVPLRRGQHPAREHPARLGAGGRRGRHAADDRQPRRPAPHRARDRATGCRAGRTSSARSGRSRSRSRTRRAPNEDAVGRTLARDRRRARQRSGRDRARPDERVGARRDDGAPLRLRRRGADDRAPSAPARRLRRHLRRRGRIRASTPRRPASSAASRSGTGCCRSRRRSRGSPPAPPTGSGSPTGAASPSASGPTSSCSTLRATSTRRPMPIRRGHPRASRASG